MAALRPMSHRDRILEVAREAGVALPDPTPPWPAHGPHDVTGAVQLRRVRALWCALMRGARDPGVPIRIARRSSIDDCSLLGLAAKTAPDLRSALRLMTEYHALWTGTPEMRVGVDRARACLRIEVLPLEGFDLAGRCRREMIVANLVQLAREIAGADLRPRGVHFAHSAPVDTSEHAEFFEAPLRFDSRFSGVELGADALERPLRHSDAALSRFLLASLDALAAELSAGAASVEQRVLRVLRERLATGLPSMEEVSRELHTSARSLRRHLEARGCRYRDLLDAVRREVAEEQLARGQEPVAELAARLGFSEPSAFYRAFRRWNGGGRLRGRDAS